jgi:hypothetical protein
MPNYQPSCGWPTRQTDVWPGMIVDGEIVWLQTLELPQTFPRFVQYGIWQYCSQSGLDVCNGNRINDAKRLSNSRMGRAPS